MLNMRTKRIFIEFPSGKRICLMWNNKDYISHIKDRVQENTGIPLEQQDVLWLGTLEPIPLDAGRTIISYNIREECVLKLVIRLRGGADHDDFQSDLYFDSMTDEKGYRIWISTLGGQSVGIVVGDNDTVRFVKQRVFESTGVPAYQQHLVYGAELEDCKTLGDYGVLPGAKVSMAVDDTDWPSFTFQSFVKLPCGKTLTIQLTTDDTIEYIKAWIASESGIPKHEQRLVSGLYQLEEGRRLSDYNIRDTANMTVLLRLRGGMFGGGGSSSNLSRSFTSDVVAAAPPQVMEDRLSAVEGSIAEIELNYATDNYVDERDALLHDQIEREAAILCSNIDAVHDRIDTVEASHTMSRDAMAAELDEHSRRIEAIIAGRLLGALAVGGGNGDQQVALSIAAIQTQITVQRSVNDLRSAVRCFSTVFDNQHKTLADQCNLLRREVASLNMANNNIQIQYNIWRTASTG